MPQPHIFFGNTGGGGGGSGTLQNILDEGILVLANAVELNFVGAGVTATNAGGGRVNITIPGGGGGGGFNNLYFHTVTAGEIAAKQLLLADVPSSPNLVMVDIEGGAPALENGKDYNIVANVFDWNGYALDGIIKAGDDIRFAFSTTAGSGLPGFTFVANAAARNALVPTTNGMPVIQLDDHSIWLYDLPNAQWNQSGFGTLGATSMREIQGYIRVLSPAPGVDAAGNQTLDLAVKGEFQKTGGNATITVNNMAEGQQFDLVMNSTGAAYALVFAGQTFRWENATQPTPTSTAARFDFYTFKKLNGIVYGSAILSMG